MLIANGVSGMDGIEYLENSHIFHSVRVTSTNLALKCRSIVRLNILHDRDYYNAHSTSEYVDKELLLTPDRSTLISDLRHGSLIFTPVVFKNRLRGFRMIEGWNGISFGHGVTTNAIAYVALSDKPVKVSKDDVEMIMEERRDYETGQFVKEWKPFEPEGWEQTSPPSHEKPVTATKGKALVYFAKDEPSEGRATASPPSRLWLYALIPLILFAILYFMRRKRVRSVLDRRGND